MVCLISSLLDQLLWNTTSSIIAKQNNEMLWNSMLKEENSRGRHCLFAKVDNVIRIE